MKNWDVTEADRARDHSKAGALLNQRLALSQAEIARHSEVYNARRLAPLHTTLHGKSTWQQPPPRKTRSRHLNRRGFTSSGS